MRSKVALFTIMVFLAQMAVLAFLISKDPRTPYDEEAHLDFLIKVSKLDMPSLNEPYGQELLNIAACSYRTEAWLNLETCGSETYSPSLAPFLGQNYVTEQVPTYYVLTAIPFKACSVLFPDSTKNCARYSNSLWVAGAAVSTFLLLIQLQPRRRYLELGLFSVAMNSLPAIALQGITVNTDSAVQFFSLFIPAMAVFLSRSSLPYRLQYVILFVLFTVALTTKPSILTAALIGALLFWLTDSREPRKLKLLATTGTLTLSLAVTFALIKLQPILRGSDHVDYLAEFIQDRWTRTTPPNVFLGIMTKAAEPFTNVVSGPLGERHLMLFSALGTLIGWILISRFRLSHILPLSHGVVKGRDSRDYSLFMIAIIILGPVALGLATWMSNGWPANQNRYFMGALTLAIVLAFASSKSKVLNYTMLTVLITLLTFTIVAAETIPFVPQG
jgi:hypothetical protein